MIIFLKTRSSLLLVILFLFFFSLCLFAFWRLNLNSVNANLKKQFTFVISPGEDLSFVSDRLAQKGLIRNSFVFKVYLKIFGFDKKIQAGSFLLSPSMDASLIANKLTFGSFDVWITIPEGLRKEEIAAIMKKNINIDEQKFITNSREGYLFPDTYLIPKNYGAQDIIGLMEKNYQQKISSLDKIVSGQDLILASIVEREARFTKDRPLVAGILKKREAAGWPLEADATVQYALGFDPLEKTWWKKNLNFNDLQIDSPYNTRKFTGFPITPICNPGLSSLKASIYPEESVYWFYLSDKKGNMHYAQTLEEHNRNINLYL